MRQMNMSLKQWLLMPFVVVLLCGLYVPSSSAGSLTFEMRSSHPNVVSLEFYSTTRSGLVWPGNGEVYLLEDSDVHNFKLSCRNGEQICYGAWVRNQSASYWGVGSGNENRCTSCCYTCSGGRTGVINLKH